MMFTVRKRLLFPWKHPIKNVFFELQTIRAFLTVINSNVTSSFGKRFHVPKFFTKRHKHLVDYPSKLLEAKCKLCKKKYKLELVVLLQIFTWNLLTTIKMCSCAS